MMVQPKLSLKLAQKQILTPGLVQMVTVLALNKLELKEMITQELVENPVLEEAAEDEVNAPEDRTSDELNLEGERLGDAPDQEILEAAAEPQPALEIETVVAAPELVSDNGLGAVVAEPPVETEAPKDPFDEIDFDTYFDDYLDPGYKSPASEIIERPSFEQFLATPTSLSDHLNWQLSLVNAAEGVGQAAQAIIGNLNDDGYLMVGLEEISQEANVTLEEAQAALEIVQQFDPAGVAARDLRECLLIQLRGLGAEGGVAWQIVADHINLLQSKDWKGLARVLGRPPAHIGKAVEMIQKLDPRPGQR
ncbi:MAG: RNA polymerase sigma-54 factor, partial [Acidobacteria bacterium]|nr:RNA polymerase sigma-54 factor [Acidobacteriota bacterium]